MSIELTNLAERFFDLVIKYKWNEVGLILSDEIMILSDIIKAAGFEFKEIVLGKLVGYYRDQDGSRTGDTFPINSFCPYKVIAKSGWDYYLATGWLDCMLRFSVFSKRDGLGRETIIESLINEIERSIPLTPIKLTTDGDMLCEHSPSIAFFSGLEYFVDHTRDKNKIFSSCVGVHMHCSGFLDIISVNQNQKVILCRRCKLRVVIPAKIETYGDLRQAFASIQ